MPTRAAPLAFLYWNCKDWKQHQNGSKKHHFSWNYETCPGEVMITPTLGPFLFFFMHATVTTKNNRNLVGIIDEKCVIHAIANQKTFVGLLVWNDYLCIVIYSVDTLIHDQ